MLPGELWGELRTRGAQVLQVNHPRTGTTFGEFQAYFDTVGLEFDFAGRTIVGNTRVPMDYLRLPNTPLFADDFDTLENWNGFKVEDTNGDGVREMTSLDRNLRDWMNFLSFGKVVAPMGNSDTHTREKDPAGLPRTMVAVPSDVPNAAGVEDDVYATLLGTADAFVDTVVTNGPMLTVGTASGVAHGRTVAPATPGGSVSFNVVAQSAEWVVIDTVEVFVNATFDPGSETLLSPLFCFTTRNPADMAAQDPCLLASGGPLHGSKLLPVRQ
jgi:hypothetical protein